ncbi:MAG: imidazole glycerol phosphate synthase subunit HisH [Planctomycetota bacterium]|jgi:glutamine amidotransferase|nr:imidazole glycerol phosphate synthase subunit HisH [Planctomycetota bacterium]
MTAILDYDAGNTESMRLALEKVGAKPEVTCDIAKLARAQRLVFPGVGSAAQCMRILRERRLDQVIRDAFRDGKPILAVCIGIQLLFDRSEEDGGVPALGVFPGQVERFIPPPDDPGVKIPHMGWNRVRFLAPHPILPPPGGYGEFYFVHSYYPVPAWEDTAVRHLPPLPGRPGGKVYGATDHAGVDFAAIVGLGSCLATQFHPEKSGEVGLAILERFKTWDGQTC